MLKMKLLPAIAVLALAACDAQSESSRSIDDYAAADKAAAPVEAPAPAPVDVAPASRAGQDRSQRASQSQAESVFQAFNAIWGQSAPVALDLPIGRQVFRSGEVTYLGSDRVVLIAYGDATSADNRGVIALKALSEGSQGLQGGPGELLFVQGGLGSTGRADWSIRRDLMSDPVMIIEDGGPWGEYSCVGANLVALTAQGPVLLQPGDRRVRPLPNPDNLPLC